MSPFVQAAHPYGVCASSPELDQLLPHRHHDRLHPRVDLQLLEDVPDMVLDRIIRNKQLFSYIPVVHPTRDELEHLHLPVGELGRGNLPWWLLRLPLREGGKLG